MHSKTPSAPVLPGAITADQKKKKEEEREREKGKKKEMHDNSCCQTKAKQKGSRKKVRDKLDTRNYSSERAKGKHLLIGILREGGRHPAGGGAEGGKG